MGSSAFTLVFLAIILMIFIAAVLWKYSILSFSVLRYVYLVYIVFFLSLYGIMILPLDVSATSYAICLATQNVTKVECHQPSNFVSDSVLTNIWRSIYWIVVAFAWIILPYSKCIVRSGQFTFLKRLRFAFIYNIIFDTIYLILFIALLCYMNLGPDKMKLDFESIKALGAATANTFGIFLLILVMGYGLVDYPRYLWKTANKKFQYNKMLFNIATVSETLFIYQNKLDKNVMQVCDALRSVEQYTLAHKYVNIIMSKLPVDQQYKIKNGHVDSSILRNHVDYNVSFTSYFYDFIGIENNPSDESVNYNDINVLVSLHTEVKHNVLTLDMNHLYFETLLESALFYDDIINYSHQCVGPIQFTIPMIYSKYTESWLPTLERIWYLYFRGITLRILSILALILSLCIVVSEITISNTSPTISILAIVMEKILKPNIHYFVSQVTAFVILSYMSICTYRTVFRMKLFDVIKIMGNHQTNIYSLLHSATIVSFFFAPICLNYLCLIHFDKGTLFHLNKSYVETSFSKIEGHFEILPFTSKYFNVYYPIIIVVVCIFAALSVATRFLNHFGFGQYSINNDYSNELITEGQAILQREKARIIRNLEGNNPNLQHSDQAPLVASISHSQLPYSIKDDV